MFYVRERLQWTELECKPGSKECAGAGLQPVTAPDTGRVVPGSGLAGEEIRQFIIAQIKHKKTILVCQNKPVHVVFFSND